MSAIELYVLADAIDVKFEDLALIDDSKQDVFISSRDFEKASIAIQHIADVQTLIKPINFKNWGSTYCSTRLRKVSQDQEMIFEINDISDLEYSPALIQGEAGQGKSMLLKNLVLKSLEVKESLPLYFELQSLKEKTIRDVILQEIENLGLTISSCQLKSLLHDGKLSIFLDGFDEVGEEYRANIATELKSLCIQHPNLIVIICSRPYSGLEHLSFLDVYDICPVSNCEEIVPIIRAYAQEEVAHSLERLIPEALGATKKVLSTPLMVVLLVLHYTHKRSMPRTIQDFYRDLFDVLINEQNRSLGKLKRPIKSGLSSSELRTFFEAFSYFVLKSNCADKCLIADYEDIAKDAAEEIELDKSPGLALNDIVSVTNLIMKNGRYYYYAHRTILEYYAASYIASMKDSDSELFYQKIVCDWSSWRGTLCFLKQIDRVRCIERFLLPSYEKLLPLTEESYFKGYSMLELSMMPSSKDNLFSDYIAADLLMPDSYHLHPGGIGVTISRHMASALFEDSAYEDIKEKLDEIFDDPNRTLSLSREMVVNGSSPAWIVRYWVRSFQNQFSSILKMEADRLYEELDYARNSKA